MAATIPSARAMLPTTSLRPFATHSSHQLGPSAATRPLRKFAARTHRFHCARAQTQEGNGADKQQAKKSAALSSAFERAAAYKKSLGKATPSADGPVEGKPAPSSASPSSSIVTPDEGKPSPLSEDVGSNVRSAQEAFNLQDVALAFNSLKTRQESEITSALAAKAEVREAGTGQKDTSQGVEVEIITRDGIVRRKVVRPGEAFSKTKVAKRGAVSSTDFIGLDFSEKKSSGKGARPAGLAVGLEAPPPGSLPKVEIITRDGKVQQGSKDGLYKPKVVTWGIFERPANISETYGGGRTIRPGEQLETEEEKKVSEARTKELLRAYHRKIGLDVDPQLKADSAKALKRGDELLERGYTQRAVQQFEKVLQQMPYQSELHGMAALQWAVSMDSSNRFQEARAMYEKIASHPNVIVRKKAKQLLYGFQAMDDLKVGASSKWDASLYRKYFDGFSNGYNTLYTRSEDDSEDEVIRPQDFVYLGLLLVPLVLLVLVVALKGR